MIRTFLLLLSIALILIVTLPFLIVQRLFYDPSKGHPVSGLTNMLAAPVLRFLLWICGAKVNFSGAENLPKGPALYVGNHQSAADIVLVLSYMRPLKGFIAKKELSRLPLVNGWFHLIGGIYIDRKNLRSSLDTMNQAEKYLSEGKSIVVFPEGTRSRGPEMNNFKPGALRCALKTGVPIVPFVIDGAYNLYEKTGKVTPAKLDLHVLPPIDTTGMDENTTELGKEIKAMIQEKLDTIRNDEENI